MEKLKIYLAEDKTICPRCKSEDFKEIDCGPDGWDDDITYTSEVCQGCGLWWDGWKNMWLVDCSSWQESEDCKEYNSENAKQHFFLRRIK